MMRESITTTREEAEARGFEPLKNPLHLLRQISDYIHILILIGRIKKNWQNDPKAVQYWIKNIKDKRYPDNFTEKTY